jgi:glycosyltransferase involved in cell wall biosynthesis
MYKDHRTAVVMPVHNEESFIEQAVSRVPDFVDLIIAVDDGSKDATWAKLSKLSDSRLVRLRHQANRGVGAATTTGYRAAIKHGVELIAVMDGDGQMDGRDLHRLLDSAIAGADFVKGNRFLDKQSINEMPRARYIGNRFFSWLTRRAAGLDASLDAQCGYTVIRRAALKRINLDGLYDRYGFPNEMLFAALGAGLKVECVPVKTVYGSEVSGINPFTSVPTILYLIARGWLRGGLAVKTGRRAIPITGGERASEIGS